MKEWCRNNNYAISIDIDIGSIVHFKLNDDFTYCVRAIIESVEKSMVVATVIDVFDWCSGAQVINGSILDIVGSELQLEHEFIHKVIDE